jgi:hypothetical protein
MESTASGQLRRKLTLSLDFLNGCLWNAFRSFDIFRRVSVRGRLLPHAAALLAPL